MHSRHCRRQEAGKSCSGNRIRYESAPGQCHGLGDARPFRGAVLLRVRSADRACSPCESSIRFVSRSFRPQIASGGRGASPPDPRPARCRCRRRLRRLDGCAGGLAHFTQQRGRGQLTTLNCARSMSWLGGGAPLPGRGLTARSRSRPCVLPVRIFDSVCEPVVPPADRLRRPGRVAPGPPDRQGTGGGGGSAALTGVQACAASAPAFSVSFPLCCSSRRCCGRRAAGWQCVQAWPRDNRRFRRRRSDA